MQVRKEIMSSAAKKQRVRKLTPEEDKRYRLIRADAYHKAPELAAAMFTLQPVYWNNKKGTWATDNHGHIYISFHGRASTWSEKEFPYVLIHEVWHPVRRHIDRGIAYRKANPGVKVDWNIAADCESNDDIINMPGAKLPHGCVYPSKYGLADGLTAEEYASRIPYIPPLDDNDDDDYLDEPGDGNGDSDSDGDSVSGDGDSNSSDSGSDDAGQTPRQGSGGFCHEVSDKDVAEADDLYPAISDTVKDYVEKKVAQEILDSIANKKKTAGNYSAEQAKWAAEVLAPPVIPWWRKMRKPLVAQVIAARGGGRSSYYELSRRNLDETICIPGKRKTDPNALIGLDTSGSMMDGSMEKAVSEATSILRSKSVKKLRVMNVTTIINSVETRRGRSIGDVDVLGGTDMRVAYDAVRHMGGRNRPTNFILLTDGETPWPEEEDRINGVHCLAGIISTEKRYERIIEEVPSWITPVHIPHDCGRNW
jgi:predicted metal-dependent peptidase